MYRIYKGYIQSIDKVKNRDNITTYSIYRAKNSLTDKGNLTFYNIAHGYQGDADANDGLYAKGTLVYFIADETQADGVIICTVQENPIKRPTVLQGDDDFSKLFQTTDKPPMTPGDYLWTKYDALVLFAYNGLLKLRSKLGLELFLNPITETFQIMAKRIKIQFGGFEGNVMSANLDKTTGAVSLNLGFTTDTTEEDKDASLIQASIGQLQTKVKRFLFAITSLLDKKIKFSTDIDKDGVINVYGDSLKINFNNQSTIEIDNQGNAYIKTKEFYLGQGDTTQPMIRGTEFAENYSNLINIIKSHRHPANGVPSFDLQKLELNKLQEGKELSKTNKLD